MRNNNLTPLLQLVEWFGIDPWKFNGIDRDEKQKPNTKCRCFFQHPWTEPKNWSRDDFIGMLEYAEQVFEWETEILPAPKQILLEEQEYYEKKINKKGQFKSVPMNYKYYVQDFGNYILELVDTYTLNRTDLDLFELTAVVPLGTDIKDVRVFFTQADAAYNGDPGYEDYIYEVRPIRNKSIGGTTFTAYIPSYLLRKPSLDEHITCLPHELDTYVEEVVVYLNVLQTCEHGYYVFENSLPQDCINSLDCDESLQPLCISKRLVGRDYWAVPKPFRCVEQEDGSFAKEIYCLLGTPTSVRLNYISGIPRLASGDTQFFVSEIINKLAVSLADCVKAWCDCDDCAEEKLKYYRAVEKTKVEEGDYTQRAVGDRYQILLTPRTMDRLTGYPLYRGFSMAFREMLKLRSSVEGGSI